MTTRASTSIREATLADVPAIVAMGCRFLRTTAFGTHVKENPEQMAALAAQLIEGDGGAVFVADMDGGVVGMIGLLRFLHPMSGEPFVSELFWWVNPDARGSSAALRLLRQGEQWTRDVGAVVLQMIAPTPEVERLYHARGFDRVETAYQKRLT
ncbi:MAG: GNAT family N-acetyltransferase [Vicinamibacterales bacterium]